MRHSCSGSREAPGRHPGRRHAVIAWDAPAAGVCTMKPGYQTVAIRSTRAGLSTRSPVGGRVPATSFEVGNPRRSG